MSFGPFEEEYLVPGAPELLPFLLVLALATIAGALARAAAQRYVRPGNTMWRRDGYLAVALLLWSGAIGAAVCAATCYLGLLAGAPMPVTFQGLASLQAVLVAAAIPSKPPWSKLRALSPTITAAVAGVAWCTFWTSRGLWCGNVSELLTASENLTLWLTVCSSVIATGSFASHALQRRSVA